MENHSLLDLYDLASEGRTGYTTWFTFYSESLGASVEAYNQVYIWHAASTDTDEMWCVDYHTPEEFVGEVAKWIETA